MRIIFFGTPDFATDSLQALIDSGYNIVAVVTQPDRPSNRGVVEFSQVKKLALKHKLNLLQPDKINNYIAQIRALNSDLGITAAFGQLLNQQLIDSFKYGIINVHASLLPKYRGSSPIQWAILNGEATTGITIMQTELALDSGDIILQKQTDIEKHENAQDLYNRLKVLGASALLEAVKQIQNGTAIKTPQKHADATYFPMLKKQDGQIDFNNSAVQIVNKIRAFTPWPSAFTILHGIQTKIISAVEVTKSGIAGSILHCDKQYGLIIACGKNAINVLQLQPSGKRILTAAEYINGLK